VFSQSELEVNFLRCFRCWSRPLTPTLGTEANLVVIELGPAELKLASGEIGQLAVDALLSDGSRRDVTADAKIVSLLDFNPQRNR
jgi:hypothetical protein